MSPLRRRMVEDMTIRNLSPATQQSYVHAVSKFSRYFGHSPDRLGLEDVRAYQVHLILKGVSWASLNQAVCALRFFYGVTLGYDAIPERIAYAREPRKRPAAPSADEVVRFLEAVSSLKARVALTTAYATGLRVSEVTGLKAPYLTWSSLARIMFPLIWESLEQKTFHALFWNCWQNSSPRALAEQDFARRLVGREVVLPAIGNVERDPALNGGPCQHRVEPAGEMRKIGEVLPVALPAPRPTDARHVGDRVAAREIIVVGEAHVHHAKQPIDLVAVAVDRIGELVGGVDAEVIGLAAHRTEPTHLPEQSLADGDPLAWVVAAELPDPVR